MMSHMSKHPPASKTFIITVIIHVWVSPLDLLTRVMNNFVFGRMRIPVYGWHNQLEKKENRSVSQPQIIFHGVVSELESHYHHMARKGVGYSFGQTYMSPSSILLLMIWGWFADPVLKVQLYVRYMVKTRRIIYIITKETLFIGKSPTFKDCFPWFPWQIHSIGRTWDYLFG